MSETHLISRFTRDVDDLLSQEGRMEPEPMSAEYREVLKLAGTLAKADFSTGSRMRGSLRRRLLDRIETRQSWPQTAVRVLRSISEPRNSLLTSIAVILMSALLFTLVWPGASATLAQSIRATVRQLALGRHTTVTQTACPEQLATVSVVTQAASATPVTSVWPDSTQTESTLRGEGNLCIINTVIGRFGFQLASDSDAVARRFSTLEEARESVPFGLRRPGYLPEGYALREVLVAPGGASFLFYESPKGNIILVQISVGVDPGAADGRGSVAAVQVLTSGAIESVFLNGMPAGWVQGHGLMWEADGISYTVGGPDLSLDEAIRVAESLD